MELPNDHTPPVLTDEQNLRLLINNTEDPIWLVDTHCRLLEHNHAFAKWIQHFTGKPFMLGDHVLHGELDRLYLDKFEMCYRLALSGRSFKSVEDFKVDGETRYATIRFHPVYDDQHNIRGVSCLARDITEQRKHLMKIEQQNTALREIAFIESHKVRGPVATILGLAQFFNYDSLEDPLNKEIMEGILKVSLDLDGIIREVVRKSNEMGLK
jgi:PAS domain S-box-containing protein